MVRVSLVVLLALAACVSANYEKPIKGSYVKEPFVELGTPHIQVEKPSTTEIPVKFVETPLVEIEIPPHSWISPETSVEVESITEVKIEKPIKSSYVKEPFVELGTPLIQVEKPSTTEIPVKFVETPLVETELPPHSWISPETSVEVESITEVKIEQPEVVKPLPPRPWILPELALIAAPPLAPILPLPLLALALTAPVLADPTAAYTTTLGTVTPTTLNPTVTTAALAPAYTAAPWGGPIAQWGGPAAQWGGPATQWGGSAAQWGGLTSQWAAPTVFWGGYVAAPTLAAGYAPTLASPWEAVTSPAALWGAPGVNEWLGTPALAGHHSAGHRGGLLDARLGNRLEGLESGIGNSHGPGPLKQY